VRRIDHSCVVALDAQCACDCLQHEDNMPNTDDNRGTGEPGFRGDESAHRLVRLAPRLMSRRVRTAPFWRVMRGAAARGIRAVLFVDLAATRRPIQELGRDQRAHQRHRHLACGSAHHPARHRDRGGFGARRTAARRSRPTPTTRSTSPSAPSPSTRPRKRAYAGWGTPSRDRYCTGVLRCTMAATRRSCAASTRRGFICTRGPAWRAC
jgi:hypothetical protein